MSEPDEKAGTERGTSMTAAETPASEKYEGNGFETLRDELDWLAQSLQDCMLKEEALALIENPDTPDTVLDAQCIEVQRRLAEENARCVALARRRVPVSASVQILLERQCRTWDEAEAWLASWVSYATDRVIRGRLNGAITMGHGHVIARIWVREEVLRNDLWASRMPQPPT